MELSEAKFVEWSNFIRPDDVDVRWFLQQVPGGPGQRMLDVGGGNGRFASIVANIGGHQVDVVDPSECASQNFVAHPACRLIRGDFFSWQPEAGLRYDVVILRLVAHHLIGRTAQETWGKQRSALQKANHLLRPGGRVYILENIYEPRFGEDLTGALIYRLTRLKGLAGLMRRLGANTAGEGVHFHSLPAWKRLCQEAGLRVEREHLDFAWAQDDFPWWQRWPLLCARRYEWLALLGAAVLVEAVA